MRVPIPIGSGTNVPDGQFGFAFSISHSPPIVPRTGRDGVPWRTAVSQPGKVVAFIETTDWRVEIDRALVSLKV